MPQGNFPLKAVWSFDIDGTLTNYPREWLNYVKTHTGRHFDSVDDAKQGLGENYATLKYQYRLSNDKYSIVVRDDAKGLIEKIRAAQGKVIISTRRPFHLFPTMQERTAQWLAENEVRFDKLISKSVLPEEDFAIHIDDEVTEIEKLNGMKKAHFILLTKQKKPEEFASLKNKDNIHFKVGIDEIHAA